MSLANMTMTPAIAMLMNMTIACFSDPYDNHSWLLDGPYKPPEDNTDDTWCPRMYDGFACWDWTPSGHVAVQNCPGFVIGFDPSRLAYKTCLQDGTWYIRQNESKSWTNYTMCVDKEDLQFRKLVNNIYVAGYSISAAALTVAIAIFVYFRSLQCARIRIHLHMFLAFAGNSILWIAWYKTVVDDIDVVKDNPAWCQVLHVVIHYFMVASYTWMFCEALHLYMALIVAFLEEDLAMRWFVATGWGVPLLLTSIYAITRYNHPDSTVRCWMDYSESYWILAIPVLISLVTSCIFLVNIVRVILTKMSNDRAPIAFKAVRAGLILVPLFGLHFLLLPLRPKPGTLTELIYQVTSAILISLQGLCVAILFCFKNNEISNLIRAYYHRYLDTHEMAVFRTDSRAARSGVTVTGESLTTREHTV